MRILLAFTSLSGNTRDVARLIRARCEARGHAVDWIEADIADLTAAGPDARHDLYLLGTWSDNAGRTPGEMKRFIGELVDTVGRPANVAVFGTGETQWGEAYYCGAVRRIARFFDSPYPRLEIEQMPHGQRDAQRIQQWTDQILTSIENTLHADPARVVA
jgi:flavodoxin I